MYILCIYIYSIIIIIGSSSIIIIVMIIMVIIIVIIIILKYLLCVYIWYVIMCICYRIQCISTRYILKDQVVQYSCSSPTFNSLVVASKMKILPGLSGL